MGSVAPLEVSANTSTIDLVDDFMPVDDDHEPKTRSRRSSAIHIKVYRVGVSEILVGQVQKDSDKTTSDTRTSEGLASQQDSAGVQSRKRWKKKPQLTKTQSS